MTKESIALKLKQTFTIKRILISLLSLFFILFFIGGCSTIFIDPKIYFGYYLCNKNGYQIIYDEDLYEKLNKFDTYTGKEIIPEDLRYIRDDIQTKIISTNKIIFSLVEKQYELYFDNKLVGESLDYGMSAYKIKPRGDEAGGTFSFIQELKFKM